MADAFRDFDELTVYAERELAMDALRTDGGRRRGDWLVTELKTMVSKKLRVPFALMPQWYRQQWPDPTQVDSLATLTAVSVASVTVLGRTPWKSGLDYATEYTIDYRAFLRALLDRQIGSAS